MDLTAPLTRGYPALKLRQCHIHLHPFPQSTLHGGIRGKIRETLLLASCVTLDKLLNLSEALLPQ